MESWVNSGYIDKGSPLSCLDANAIMSAFKITSTPKLREDFLGLVPIYLLEMMENCHIEEESYNQFKLSIDTDAQGNEYPILSDALHQRRSFPIYHKNQTTRRKDVLEEFARKKKQYHERSLQAARQMLADNCQCEIQLTSDAVACAEIFEILNHAVACPENIEIILIFLRARTLLVLTYCSMLVARCEGFLFIIVSPPLLPLFCSNWKLLSIAGAARRPRRRLNFAAIFAS